MTTQLQYRTLKEKAIAAVTGGPIECQICHFSHIRALQFDHIKQVNRQTKIKGIPQTGNPLRGGASMVKAILSGHQDISELQVLCANCHCLKDERN